MRLIDADKLIEKNIEDMYINTDFMTAAVLSAFNKILMNEPVIKAEPVRHGEWLYNDMYLPNCAECSECGWQSSVSGDEIPSYRYCPHCGAKMDGNEKEW